MNLWSINYQFEVFFERFFKMNETLLDNCEFDEFDGKSRLTIQNIRKVCENPRFVVVF